MTTDQIVQSWKDEDYTRSLSAAEQALLPENPAGMVELSDEELMGVQGGEAALTGYQCAIAISISLAITISTIA